MPKPKDVDYVKRMNVFVDRLELLITRYGSVNKLADRCAIDHTTMINWRKRRSLPTLDMAMKLSAGAGVSLDWLIGNTSVEVSAPQMGIRGICNATGLSEQAVTMILREKKFGRKPMVEFVDKAIRWLLRPTKSELRVSVAAYIMWKGEHADGKGVRGEKQRDADPEDDPEGISN